MNARIIIISQIILLGVSLCFAQFAGGTGTENDPWQISTPVQLDSVRIYLGAVNSDKHFILINNIDMDVPPYNSGDGWIPYGNATNQFTGHFDGDGFAIENLFILRPNNFYSSLFGYLGQTGTIIDLHLVDVNVTGGSQAAGLVGNNRGTVVNSSVSGDISGQTGVGAIAGENNLGLIENCHSLGTITAQGNNGGGLVGRNRLNSTISGSHSTSEVTGTGNNSYGGLVGWNDSVIIDCYATGNVDGRIFSGGLVGRNYRGSVTNCYATGDVVSTQDFVGGLAGGNGGIDDAFIYNSYATGYVQGNSAVGGLAGENHGYISNCYALGDIWGINSSPSGTGVGGFVGELHEFAEIEMSYSVGHVSGNAPIGGFVGFNDNGFAIACYWNTETSGQTASAAGTGMTTAQMVQQDSYHNMWDFTEVWQIIEGTTYPYLRDNPQDPPPTPYGQPGIEVTPLSFSVDIDLGEVITENLLIVNTGDAPLVFELHIDEIPDSDNHYLQNNRQEWLSFNPPSGVVAAGGSMEIDVIFDASQLDNRTTYTADIIIVNNASDPIIISVTMEVTIPDFLPPGNLQIDTQTGLLTWDAPPLRESKEIERTGTDRLELIEYNLYLDGVHIAATDQTYYQFIDLAEEQEYVAGVQAVYVLGNSEIVTIEFVYEGVSASLPPSQTVTSLQGNHPNPFNPETNIKFTLQMAGSVTIEIFDARGALISTIVDGYLAAGQHEVIWNGKKENGSSAGSGVYFYRMKADDYIEARKMLLLK